MKGWQLIELRREVEGRQYRFTAAAGVPATEMMEVMQDWIYELEAIQKEYAEKSEDKDPSDDSSNESVPTNSTDSSSDGSVLPPQE